MAGMILFSTGMAQSQEIFPAGQGRNTLFLVCVQCHALDRVIEAKLNAGDWEFTLYDMISRGAPVREEDIETLKKYLVDNFAVETK